MINRELIRIKTVQLLYSYLLVENPFSLESQPSAPTKEKRFAYSLYLDLLVLLTRLARRIDPRAGYPLTDTRFFRNVNSDERIRSLVAKYSASEFPFGDLEEHLATAIKDSAIYKKFKTSLGESSFDENVWKDIFDLIVITDPALNAEISRRQN